MTPICDENATAEALSEIDNEVYLTPAQEAALSNTICGEMDVVVELEEMGLVTNVLGDRDEDGGVAFFRLTPDGERYMRTNFDVAGDGPGACEVGRATPSDFSELLAWRRVQRLRTLYRLYVLSTDHVHWGTDWVNLESAVGIKESELELAVRTLEGAGMATLDTDLWVVSATVAGVLALEAVVANDADRPYDRAMFPDAGALRDDLALARSVAAPEFDDAWSTAH